MQCTHPSKYNRNGTFITQLPACGTCLSCRLNDRAIWASRLVCERKAHTKASFVTFTYSDEHLPTDKPHAVEQFQKFIKRLRKIEPNIRYYSVLEYGTRHGRAHWHAIFFGRDTEITPLRKNGHSIRVDLTMENQWGHGSTYTKACDDLSQGMNITNYVASYLLKGIWNQSEGNDLAKQECSLQSRKPYIAKPLQNAIIELLTTRKGARRCAILGTIPEKLKFHNRYYRLYPRLRREICEDLDYEYNPVPRNNGVILDLDGNGILNEKPYATKTKNEAVCHELSIAAKIRQNRRKNTSAHTG